MTSKKEHLYLISLSSFMEEEKMFYKHTISNAKKKKDRLEQKSCLRGNKTDI